jgi:excisionase family DNA binding protein
MGRLASLRFEARLPLLAQRHAAAGSAELTLPDKEVLTVKEVARALDCHLSSVWRFMLRGVRGHRLPSFFVGSRRRVRRDDVVAWLQLINAGRHDAAHVPATKPADRNRDGERTERELIEAGF